MICRQVFSLFFILLQRFLFVFAFLLLLHTLVRELYLALACSCARVRGFTGSCLTGSRLLALNPITEHRKITLLIMLVPLLCALWWSASVDGGHVFCALAAALG